MLQSRFDMMINRLAYRAAARRKFKKGSPSAFEIQRRVLARWPGAKRMEMFGRLKGVL
jgi:hypothetical protein